MDIAIVTGAETPLGLRLIEELIRQGCRVHGIGNNFSNVTFADRHFIAHAVDLSDLAAVARTTEQILEKEQSLHILIHAIDVTPGAPFEKLPVGNLEAILKVGLLGPIMLTRLALPNLLRFRGQLINIIPANKSGHVASAVNALIEGGLREMNSALFDQARDAGLRVTNLILRQNTSTDQTANADKQIQTCIDPEHVARTVERLLDPNEPNVPNEITLYPRLSAAAEAALPESALPIDPYSTVVLPPKEYFPPKQEAIPTKQPDQIERTIPYTDEEMEEKISSAIEDYEAHPERYEEPQSRKKNRRERKPRAERSEPRVQQDDTESTDAKQHDEADTEQSDASKRRRGRRRGGRNRNRNQQDENANGERSEASKGEQPPRNTPDHQPHLQSPGAEKEQPSPQGDKDSKSAPSSEEKAKKTPKPGRNRSRKPVVRPEERYADYEQPIAAAQDLPKVTPEPVKAGAFQPGEIKVEATQPVPTAKVEPKPAATAEAEPAPTAAAKAVKKKAAKKTTKKAATKKAATKKAAKKAVKKSATKKAAKKAAKKAVKKAKAAE
jgi:NAD(P)-dependent dehydrogenase (short-subunit alcohol dehydrogenase family)